jgi:hypothetical protein
VTETLAEAKVYRSTSYVPPLSLGPCPNRHPIGLGHDDWTARVTARCHPGIPDRSTSIGPASPAGGP